jgi:hypothetical protein
MLLQPQQMLCMMSGSFTPLPDTPPRQVVQHLVPEVACISASSIAPQPHDAWGCGCQHHKVQRQHQPLCRLSLTPGRHQLESATVR